jgi:hypothetical protein
MPLLRLGAYFEGELSPSGDPGARRIYAGGLRLKVTPPSAWGPNDTVRPWAYLGFGAAGVYAPSYKSQLVGTLNGAPETQTVDAKGAGGYFFEIPIGAGVSWRFRKPYELNVEGTFRIGVGNGGTLYSKDGRPASVSGANALSGLDTTVASAGQDSWAFGILVGIGLDL